MGDRRLLLKIPRRRNIHRGACPTFFRPPFGLPAPDKRTNRERTPSVQDWCLQIPIGFRAADSPLSVLG